MRSWSRWPANGDNTNPWAASSLGIEQALAIDPQGRCLIQGIRLSSAAQRQSDPRTCCLRMRKLGMHSRIIEHAEGACAHRVDTAPGAGILAMTQVDIAGTAQCGESKTQFGRLGSIGEGAQQ